MPRNSFVFWIHDSRSTMNNLTSSTRPCLTQNNNPNIKTPNSTYHPNEYIHWILIANIKAPNKDVFGAVPCKLAYALRTSHNSGLQTYQKFVYIDFPWSNTSSSKKRSLRYSSYTLGKHPCLPNTNQTQSYTPFTENKAKLVIARKKSLKRHLLHIHLHSKKITDFFFIMAYPGQLTRISTNPENESHRLLVAPFKARKLCVDWL